MTDKVQREGGKEARRQGDQDTRHALASICKASLVDITPTIFDVLGLLPSFSAALQHRPDEVKGHSLKPAMDHILTKAPRW
jgi:hypothetical protein